MGAQKSLAVRFGSSNFEHRGLLGVGSVCFLDPDMGDYGLLHKRDLFSRDLSYT